jgi:hypothetical protein
MIKQHHEQTAFIIFIMIIIGLLLIGILDLIIT